MQAITTAAREALEFFETRTRDDGTTFDAMKDDRPEWVFNLTYDAHGDFGPDDWKFAAVRSALETIAGDGGSTEDLDDLGHEWADGYVDVYTAARTAWLASNLNRVGYCDEAREEFGHEDADIVSILGWGQYMEAREVWASVTASLEAHALSAVER